MTYATIDALRSQLGQAPSAHSPEYVAKMLHEVPESETVDRTVFILKRVAGKRVLEFGASGPMHDGIVKAATFVLGVDRENAPGVVGFDLDSVVEPRLPPEHDDNVAALSRPNPPFDLIVCGEVIEHLSNPGWFLKRLRQQYEGVPLLVTVPNAFSEVSRQHMKGGTENVNRDHVAWYSYTTLTTLLARAGYVIRENYWYTGNPYTAEGLIVVAE